MSGAARLALAAALRRKPLLSPRPRLYLLRLAPQACLAGFVSVAATVVGLTIHLAYSEFHHAKFRAGSVPVSAAAACADEG